MRQKFLVTLVFASALALTPVLTTTGNANAAVKGGSSYADGYSVTDIQSERNSGTGGATGGSHNGSLGHNGGVGLGAGHASAAGVGSNHASAAGSGGTQGGGDQGGGTQGGGDQGGGDQGGGTQGGGNPNGGH